MFMKGNIGMKKTSDFTLHLALLITVPEFSKDKESRIEMFRLTDDNIFLTTSERVD